MKAIKVENLSKSTLVGHNSAQAERYTALRDVLARKSRDMLTGRQIVQGDEVEEFWALKDITTTFNSATAIGLVSHGGPGQSTGLKILSRITEPTKGRMKITGHVVSLCLPEPCLYYSPNSSLIQRRV